MTGLNRWKNSIVFFMVLVIDQISKWVAREYEFAQINTGGVLGIAEGSWWLGIGVVLVLLLVVLYLKSNDQVKRFWLVLILASGMSNLIDRLVFGGVWDWICYPVINVCGNIADIFLVAAIIAYGFYPLRHEKND